MRRRCTPPSTMRSGGRSADLSSNVSSASQKAEPGELAAHLGRQLGDALGPAGEIGWSIGRLQIAPALERAPRRQAHGDELAVKQDQAGARAVALGPVLKSGERL